MKYNLVLGYLLAFCTILFAIYTGMFLSMNDYWFALFSFIMYNITFFLSYFNLKKWREK